MSVVKKQAIVWQDPSSVGNVLGTALELFNDCEVTFHANEGKRVNLRFKNSTGQTASVLLSNSLMPEYKAGKLDNGTIMTLPIYLCTDMQDDEGNIIKGDDGQPLSLMVAGKPETKGVAVKDMKVDKIVPYQSESTTAFDSYF